MPVKSWTILDHSDNTLVEDGWQLDGGRLGILDASVRVTQHRCGLSQGVTTVRLRRGPLELEVVPTRGMGLWKMSCDGVSLGWQSPIRGPVHPAFVPTMEPGGLGWLDGFDELLVHCGLESNGAPEFNDQGLLYPLHGRISGRPAHHVRLEAEGDELRLIGVVEETRFHFLKLRMTSTMRIRAGQRQVHIEDQVENLSASDVSTQMLYHVNFGPPLLDAGARVVAPVETVVPRNEHAAAAVANWSHYEAPQPGYAERVYFLKLLADQQQQSQVMLTNAHGTLAASLHFSVKDLPCFTIWKNTTALEDGCVTGLEPGTNFPNPRSFEAQHDRVRTIAPRESYTYRLAIQCHAGEADVQRAAARIAELQGGHATQVYDAPQDDWCAA